MRTIPQPGSLSTSRGRHLFAVLAAFAAALWCAPLWAQDQPPDEDDAPAQQQEPAQRQESAGAPAGGAEQEAADGREPGTADEATEDAADGAAAEETADGTVADDSDLDQQTYEGDDDVFVPSEEIPVDEPIPFPSDI
ncbi:MAG TPA: hypothetical protein VNQ14_06430 [Woeseiaceae bacterium]|nr:hypothetical protein [Woeseiaceae bacterium]